MKAKSKAVTSVLNIAIALVVFVIIRLMIAPIIWPWYTEDGLSLIIAATLVMYEVARSYIRHSLDQKEEVE